MAMTLEYGKCASCGRENPKAIEQCRGCNAVLPWVKSATKAAAPGNNAVADVKPKVGLGDLAWGGMAVALGGGAVFVRAPFYGAATSSGFSRRFRSPVTSLWQSAARFGASVVRWNNTTNKKAREPKQFARFFGWRNYLMRIEPKTLAICALFLAKSALFTSAVNWKVRRPIL